MASWFALWQLGIGWVGYHQFCWYVLQVNHGDWLAPLHYGLYLIELGVLMLVFVVSALLLVLSIDAAIRRLASGYLLMVVADMAFMPQYFYINTDARVGTFIVILAMTTMAFGLIELACSQSQHRPQSWLSTLTSFRPLLAMGCYVLALLSLVAFLLIVQASREGLLAVTWGHLWCLSVLLRYCLAIVVRCIYRARSNICSNKLASFTVTGCVRRARW